MRRRSGCSRISSVAWRQSSASSIVASHQLVEHSPQRVANQGVVINHKNLHCVCACWYARVSGYPSKAEKHPRRVSRHLGAEQSHGVAAAGLGPLGVIRDDIKGHVTPALCPEADVQRPSCLLWVLVGHFGHGWCGSVGTCALCMSKPARQPSPLSPKRTCCYRAEQRRLSGSHNLNRL